MGARAERDLAHSLDRIIDQLDQIADDNISLTPTTIREVTRTLRVMRDCHASLAEYEALIDSSDGKVVPIHSVKVGRAS